MSISQHHTLEVKPDAECRQVCKNDRWPILLSEPVTYIMLQQRTKWVHFIAGKIHGIAITLSAWQHDTAEYHLAVWDKAKEVRCKCPSSFLLFHPKVHKTQPV